MRLGETRQIAGHGLHDEVFGQGRRPFDERVDAACTYLTPELEETLAAVDYEIRFGRSTVLVVGEAGLGKTHFVRTMLLRLNGKDHAVVLTWPASGKRDLLREVCKAFGVSISDRSSDARRLARLERHLARLAHDDSRNVLFIDQAENLNEHHLSELMTLAELESQGGKRLTIVLAAQPRLLRQLEQPEQAPLKQRLFGERVLKPLTRAQTVEYVRHRLARSGKEDADLFEPEAINWIHQRARGIPRLINQLCNQAMLAAYGAGEPKITLATLAGMAGPVLADERTMKVESLGLPNDHASFDVRGRDRQTSRNDDRSGTNAPSEARRSPSETQRAPSDTRRSVDDPVRADVGEPPSETRRSVEARRAPADVTSPHDTDMDADFIPANDLATEPYSMWGATEDPQNQDALAYSMDSLFARGEVLLDRLERALARADRMAVSTESAYVRHRAMEGHLDALAQRSERLIEEWRRTGPDVARSLSEAARQAQAMDRAREQARSTETKLVEAARSVAEKADDAHDRLARLMDALASGQSVEAKLTEMTRRNADAGAECDARIQKLNAILRELDDRAQRIDAALHNEAVDALERRIQESVETARRCVSEIETRTSNVQRTISEAGAQFDRFESTCRDRILELCQSTIEDRRASFQRALHEVAEASKRQVDTACARASEFVADSESRVGVLRATWNETIATSGERLAEMTAAAKHLESQEERLQQTLDLMNERMTSVVERLTSSTHAGESVIEALSAERGRCDELRRTIAETASKATEIARQVDQTRDQAARCERIREELSDQSSAAERLVNRLSQSTASAEQTNATLESTLAMTKDQTHRLDSHNAAASATLKELATTTINGRGVIESLKSTLREVGESISRAEARAQTLATGDQDRAEIARRLGLLVQAAHKLDASLRSGLERAGDRQSLLASTTAEACAAQEEISRATRDGREVVKQVEKTTADGLRSVTDRTQQMDRLLQEVGSLTSKAEATVTRLAADLTRGRELESSLSEHWPQVQSLRDELTGAVERAIIQAQTLASHEQRATGWIQQLASIDETFEAARDLHERVLPAIEEARSLCGDLASTAADARQQGVVLEELQRNAAELTRVQATLNEESEPIVKTLSDQLKTARACTESSETILLSFVQQAEAIEKQLMDFEARVRAMHQTLDIASEKPERLLKQAEQQSNTLARVTEAVRKVSAGLAQTTLDAKRHLDALERVNRQAAERLAAVATLTNTTRRAAQTLQAWMQESSAVQDRIGSLTEDDGALKTQPGIDRLAGLPRIADPRSIGEPAGMRPLSKLPAHGESASATVASERTAVATKTRPAGATPRSAAKAAEIARLIEESQASPKPATS